MSDLRNSGDFNSAPMAPEGIRATENGFGEKHTIIDNGGLSGFHHFEEKEEGSGKAKVIGGALVVALLLGAASLLCFQRLGHSAGCDEGAGFVGGVEWADSDHS